MRYQEFFLTDDAVDDLAKLEAYVLSYQSTNFIEILEDRFFEAFHGLLTQTDQHPVYQFEPPVPALHTYRSINVYNYKVFYYVDGRQVIIYRIRHLLSDFSRVGW